MKNEIKQRVAVGMSGGVDSSVAAALLKEQGHEVIGVFMKFWSENIKGKIRENICCSLESSEDARQVCNKLGVPFYVIDMKVPFKKKIVDDFVNEYECGHTPNPCVRCNQYIKFEELWKKLKPMGVDFVATGHYARVETIHELSLPPRALLRAGRDKNKDQSYFLHQIQQKHLKHTLFPLGDYTKPNVRKLAKKYGLSTASKKESQEICFVADGKVGEFLKRYIKFEKGNIVDVGSEDVLGQHEGLPLYTIGQRKGIGLAGGPWYVVQLDKKKNILWVSKDEKDLHSKELIVRSVNWISGEQPKLPLKCKCKIRYRSDFVVATIHELSQGKYRVEFTKPQRAITSGQYCVFYKGEECLGGGVIE